MTVLNAQMMLTHIARIEELMLEIKKIRPELNDDVILNLIAKVLKNGPTSLGSQ